MSEHEYHETYQGIYRAEEAHKAGYEKEGLYGHGHHLAASLSLTVPVFTYKTSKEVKETAEINHTAF